MVSAEDVDGLIRITWHRPEDSWSWVLWVDPNMGFVPTRYCVGKAETKTPHEVLRIQDESETTWEIVNDVAVPVSWTAQSYRMSSQSVDLRYTLDFEWTDINEVIDESAFTWQGAGLPHGTRVYDDRLGKSVMVGRVGMELPEERLFEDRPEGVPTLAPSLSSTAKWLWVAAVSAVILTFCLVTVYVKRRSR